MRSNIERPWGCQKITFKLRRSHDTSFSGNGDDDDDDDDDNDEYYYFCTDDMEKYCGNLSAPPAEIFIPVYKAAMVNLDAGALKVSQCDVKVI
jgi:hypothetical protein